MTASTSTNTLHEAAAALHEAGFSPIPVAADGSKRPRIPWKPYTIDPAARNVVDGWFTNNVEQGVGVITGVGGLELLEVEGKGMDLMGAVLELLDATGMRDLYRRILAGWSEQSPSGGLHLFYRINGAPVDGNKKIAQRPTDTGRETLAETRGTGGFVVVAPSGGNVHPTGVEYRLINGGPRTVATITVDERDQLHAIFFQALDSMPTAPEPAAPLTGLFGNTRPAGDGDVTPGDDYERTTWDEILTGWTNVFTHGHTRYWRRPGKKDGFSATTGHATDRDRLYVFTTSTEFEPETPYTKFGAYTVLHHAGDHSKAAAALAANGFGHRADREIPPPVGARVNGGGEIMAAITTQQEKPKVMWGGSAEHLTDVGNANVLVERHAKNLRYVPDAGKWVTWTGARWEWQPDDGAVIEAAKETILALPSDHPELAKWRKNSLTARKIGDAARLARSAPAMRVSADQFDQHPWQLNTPAGVINLRTGEKANPLPAQFHSKQTLVAPDWDQPTPLWDRFRATTFQDNTALEQYVQRLAGVSAIGEVREHVLPFLHGPGGNGKTVLLEVLTSLLADYATEAPAGFLLAGRDKHETELANLRGRRLVVASEVNESTRFDEAKMKMLTGGDKITARFMRQDFFTFTPTHTLWLAGNNQPKVETGGHSFWRRLRLIPFTHTVPDEQKIDGLAERLVAEEGPGILAWIITGAIAYAATGIPTPDEVLAATSEYQAEEDHLARFIEDRCILTGNDTARVEMGELRAVYQAWCKQQGEPEISGTALGRQLKQKFDLGSAKSNGRRFYTGVVLTTPDTDDSPDDEHVGDVWRG